MMNMVRVEQASAISRSRVSFGRVLGGMVAGVLMLASGAQEVSVRKLAVGDTVEVEVHLEPKVSGTFTVDQQGHLKIPLLGRVKVVDLTEQEVGMQIETGLEKSFIRDASVAVHIIDRKSITVNVLGKVATPGPVSFQQGQAAGLYQALVAAGLPTEDADPSKIEIIREVGDSIKTHTVNVEHEKMYPLLEGDTVVVPAVPPEEASKVLRLVTMLGQVGNPGRIEIPPGLELDLLTAIAKAGGLTRTARESKVTIHRKRKEGGGEETIIVDFSKIQRGQAEPILLQEGDTVFVPESFF